MRGQRNPIHTVSTWVRRQPPKVKAFLAVVSGMAALVLLRVIVHDHDNLFVAAEAVHSIGISVLIYKLMKERTCAGKVSNFFLGAGRPRGEAGVEGLGNFFSFGFCSMGEKSWEILDCSFTLVWVKLSVWLVFDCFGRYFLFCELGIFSWANAKKKCCFCSVMTLPIQIRASHFFSCF